MDDMSEQTIQRVTDSATSRVIERMAIIVVTALALPFGAWAGYRLVTAVDALAADMAVVKTDMAVVKTDIGYLKSDVAELNDDHNDPFRR